MKGKIAPLYLFRDDGFLQTVKKKCPSISKIQVSTLPGHSSHFGLFTPSMWHINIFDLIKSIYTLIDKLTVKIKPFWWNLVKIGQFF